MDEGRFPPGTLLAQRYRIVSLLGRGGMGEVYRANDLLLGQTVALKFLPPAFSSDEELLNRFRSEVRIARMVSHPNVCRVFDIGEVEGSTYLSMEYVDGEDLSSLLRRIGALPHEKALEIAREICAGLAAAHDKGVIHRDLKPANIMIDGQGQARVTDFGLAGFAQQLRDVRSGTPAYMAPEQRSGTGVSVKSDIYSLGIVLSELFTGKRPDDKGSATALDPVVERVIQRCLSDDPEKRPATARAVSATLPGGDPLAMALAAGETPTPEMVANAGAAEGMRPGTAVLCLAAVIVLLAGLCFVRQRASIVNRMPLELPSQALAAKARELAKSFGYTEPPSTTAAHWVRFVANGSPTLVFWYRESPALMFAPPNGEIQRYNPPLSQPGMLTVTLDSEGRLLEFRARPLASGQKTIDWRPLLAAARLDPDRLSPAAPEWTPDGPCDAQAAWVESARRVEAGGFRGQPVFFRLSGPWASSSAPEESVPHVGLYILGGIVLALLAIPLVRRNIRLGRGDRKGAYFLGIFTFVCQYGLRVVQHTHSLSVTEIDVQLDAIAQALTWATFYAMMYLAFEPYVRRRSPERLFSWNRLVAGKTGEPLLGSHVLAGTALGCALAALPAAGWLLAPAAYTPLLSLTPAANASSMVLRIFWSAIIAANFGVSTTLLLMLLRVAVRRDWAAIALMLAIAVPLLPTSLTPAIMLASALPMWFLLRMGLLPLIVAMFTSSLLRYFHLTTDLSAWHAQDTFVAVGIVLALALYGFRTALAGRPVWGKASAEDVFG